MKKIVLRNHLSPGDIVMLTAAVRDLHALNPGRFLTDVRTTAKDLWKHNPYLTTLDPNADDVETIDCHYPLIHRSNQTPYHFIHGFEQFLADKLRVPITPTLFKGDVHLSQDDRRQQSQVEAITGEKLPFWIVVAGGKNDFTIKWWETERYQAVVDYFRDKILFVQVGESNHNHPALSGVVDLRGKTNIRQLVRLVHHSQGVLCPVTFLMHLSAAVEARPDAPPARPCVVVAGGREPVHWEAYPHHQFLHTQGALSCCLTGGCWRARTLPLGDGDPKDLAKNRCVDVVGKLPRCMDMITPQKVVSAIETYFEAGVISFLGKNRSRDIGFRERRSGSVRPKEKIRNKVCLRVSGLRRSGLHPITNWIAGLYQGSVCYVNDVNHQKALAPNHPSDSLPAIDGKMLRPVELSAKKDLLLVGYEDARLIFLRDNQPDENLFGKSREFRDILVIRDPFNTFASRLRLMRDESHNPFVFDFLLPDENQTPLLPRRWRYLAEEALGITNHLADNKIVLLYNRWVADEDYRRWICSQLGAGFSDAQLEAIPVYGFGSSFEKRSKNGRASEMRVDRRWEEFAEESDFWNLFSDPAIFSLSEKLFGDCFDHEALRKAYEMNGQNKNLNENGVPCANANQSAPPANPN